MLFLDVYNEGMEHEANTANLFDYQTGEYLRLATPEETSASLAAADVDGGSGVIIVDGRSAYVECDL